MQITETSRAGTFTTITINKRYVVKRMAEGKLQQLIDEFEIMNMLHHPNIQKAQRIIINDPNIPPSILVEYFPYNLKTSIENKMATNFYQVFMIFQIAQAMKYIHSHNIIHLNLRPVTILISEIGIVKISGFDNSKLLTDENQNELSNDIYSFGIIVYFILSGGKMPDFNDKDALKQFTVLAKQLITECCASEVEKRPSFESICDILEKNEFKLLSLSQEENQELTQLINQYKKQVSF